MNLSIKAIKQSLMTIRKIPSFRTHKYAPKNILLEKVNAGIESQYCRERAFELYKQSTNLRNPKINYQNEKKFSILRDYIFKYGKENPKLADELYTQHYLSNIDKPMAKILRKINRRFGVKVFMMDEATLADANFIYKELEAYYKASGGNANLGHVINVTKLNNYGKNVGAWATYSKNIEVNGTENLQHTLRHELMHLNDKNPSNPINDLIVWCMKVIKKQNKPLSKQFRHAGIEEYHINYAYKNADEFIAVASEGNVDKYNKSFTKILRIFGMPKWAFRLKPNQIKMKQDAVLSKQKKEAGKNISLMLKNLSTPTTIRHAEIFG